MAYFPPPTVVGSKDLAVRIGAVGYKRNASRIIAVISSNKCWSHGATIYLTNGVGHLADIFELNRLVSQDLLDLSTELRKCIGVFSQQINNKSKHAYILVVSKENVDHKLLQNSPEVVSCPEWSRIISLCVIQIFCLQLTSDHECDKLFRDRRIRIKVTEQSKLTHIVYDGLTGHPFPSLGIFALQHEGK